MGNIQANSITVGSLLDKDFSETSLRHEYVTISSRREGGIDSGDLSLFQLSILGQEGAGKLKYAQCHSFCHLFGGRPILIIRGVWGPGPGLTIHS